MRFMLFMMPGPKAEAGVPPSAELVTAMLRLNEEMAAAGVLLALDGLQPTSKGARVSFANGESTVEHGPFAGDHLVGGYWHIRVDSQEEAIAWARRVPADDGNVIEVRQVFELTDFPDDVQDAAAREIKLCAQLGQG